MSSKRELKKEIRYVCGDIAAECLLASHFVKGTDKKAMNEVIGEVADLQVNALRNVTFAFDKQPHDFGSGNEYSKARRAYFKKAYNSLREKFYAKVQELVRKMNAAIPAEVKENNTKA